MAVTPVTCIVGFETVAILTEPMVLVRAIPITSTLALVPPKAAIGYCAITVIPNIYLHLVRGGW